MALNIPETLAAFCRNSPSRTAWLDMLPEVVGSLMKRWALSPDLPLEGEQATCSFVSPVRTENGTPAVLKLGMPHMEARDEVEGLRFWNGDGTVQLLDADDALGAMLLERCQPGTVLRSLPEPDQDSVIATLLRRLWRKPPAAHPFRSLSTMTRHWSEETLAQAEHWPDAGLVREGLVLFKELPLSAKEQVLLATDLHAGNVLRAEREPWLVIDPKPFVGDPAYDATQHLLNCFGRLRSDPARTIQSFSDLLHVDANRVRLWTFARLSAEPRGNWNNQDELALARMIMG